MNRMQQGQQIMQCDTIVNYSYYKLHHPTDVILQLSFILTTNRY